LLRCLGQRQARGLPSQATSSKHYEPERHLKMP
jgi:hypothetical protein